MSWVKTFYILFDSENRPQCSVIEDEVSIRNDDAFILQKSYFELVCESAQRNESISYDIRNINLNHQLTKLIGFLKIDPNILTDRWVAVNGYAKTFIVVFNGSDIDIDYRLGPDGRKYFDAQVIKIKSILLIFDDENNWHYCVSEQL